MAERTAGDVADPRGSGSVTPQDRQESRERDKQRRQDRGLPALDEGLTEREAGDRVLDVMSVVPATAPIGLVGKALNAVADLAGVDSLQPTRPPPTEDPNRNVPNDDERFRLFGVPIPQAEEELPIVPGDPDDLGERGRRRRTRDDATASPVLRRGLLGV